MTQCREMRPPQMVKLRVDPRQCKHSTRAENAPASAGGLAPHWSKCALTWNRHVPTVTRDEVANAISWLAHGCGQKLTSWTTSWLSISYVVGSRLVFSGILTNLTNIKGRKTLNVNEKTKFRAGLAGSLEFPHPVVSQRKFSSRL